METNLPEISISRSSDIPYCIKLTIWWLYHMCVIRLIHFFYLRHIFWPFSIIWTLYDVVRSCDIFAQTLSINYDNMLLLRYYYFFLCSRNSLPYKWTYKLLIDKYCSSEKWYSISRNIYCRKWRRKKSWKFYMQYANTHMSNCFWPNVGQDNISYNISNITIVDDMGHCYSMLGLEQY